MGLLKDSVRAFSRHRLVCLFASNISVEVKNLRQIIRNTTTDGRGKTYSIVGRTEIKKKRNESAVLTAYSQVTNDQVQGLYVVM